MKAISFLRNVAKSFGIYQTLVSELNRDLTKEESDMVMNLCVFSKLSNEEIVKEVKEMSAK